MKAAHAITERGDGGGGRPAAARSALPARVLRAARNRLWFRREVRFYCYEADRIGALPRPRLLARDRFADLERYARAEAEQLPPEQFHAEARARRERGDHLYSLVEQGVLLHYGWLTDRQERGVDPAVGQVFFPPPDSAALYDFFTHPSARGRGIYYQSLCQILHDARGEAGARRAYISVFAHNRPSRRVIEKVGFEYVGSLFKERRLLAARRYAVAAPGAEFNTGLL